MSLAQLNIRDVTEKFLTSKQGQPYQTRMEQLHPDAAHESQNCFHRGGGGNVAPPQEFVVGATHRWVCRRAQGEFSAYTSQNSSPRPSYAPN
jgi:hypothetical protein